MTSYIQPSTQEDGETSETSYFTDGELLPWKGKWFRVQLREIEGEKLLTLVMLKPTAASVKRSQRAERWNEQHSRRSGVKRELLHLARLWKSRHGGGGSSGSPVSVAASA